MTAFASPPESHHSSGGTNVPPLEQECLTFPAVIIGTGISGLFTALKLAKNGIDTLLLTKSSLDEGSSRYAQGGIAAVLPANTEDSLDLHVRDTLLAGAGLCDETAVRSILSEGYAAIEDLLHHGVPFDRDRRDQLALGLEAAHSVARILHVGGDATGHSVEMTLIKAVKENPRIRVIEYAPVTELLTENGRCTGCCAVDTRQKRELIVASSQLILATGGIGQMYSHTTNPSVSTGDGIALAAAAGAPIDGMEFTQFHPTAFYANGGVRFLVSEALRGEGGILRNTAGEPFARRYHPEGELAPRDIVTRAIYSEMRTADQPHVWLDITSRPAELLETRFPTILAHALEFGVDIRTDWIPVAPAAHYLMGGVVVDTQGASTLPGLYAVGEVANTGLHGANRLASNSLLECVVLARRVATLVAAQTKAAADIPQTNALPEPNMPTKEEDVLTSPRQINSASPWTFEPQPAIEETRNTLRSLMWEHVGILRDEAGLRQALEKIDVLSQQAKANNWAYQLPAGLVLANQLAVGRQMVQAALHRRRSLGAHMRLDAPDRNDNERVPEPATTGPCGILLS
jgi:L-aspartate oxidase